MRLQNRHDNSHFGNHHKALVSALLLALATLLGCQASPTGADMVSPGEILETQPPESSQSGQADLTISSINFSPGSPKLGDEITFWVLVRNEGSAQAGASRLRFKVGGESNPPETQLPALGPGQEYRHERKITLSVAQSYLATATADALSQVSESNEGNNVGSKSFTVAAAPTQGTPDLVISNIVHSPASLAAGSEITFWVYVSNTGSAQAGASTLRFKVGGETFPPEAPVPALAPGQEYRYERKISLDVAQNYLATATADALGQVSESDEANNVRTFSFSVGPPQADLVIRLINHSPAGPHVGDEITFWVFVKNEGSAQAGASRLRFKVGGESRPPVVSVPALQPGQEYRYERKLTLSVAQNYLATATADALAQVLEADESNNVRTRSFTVAQ